MSVYEDSAPNQAQFGGPNGDVNKTTHIICSPSLDPECVKIEDQGGVLVAVLDSVKTAAKQEQLWKALRFERDRKLSACDWTVLSDSPLNTTDKNAWKAYRQELRDLPENTEDPANPVWPDEPDQEI